MGVGISNDDSFTLRHILVFMVDVLDVICHNLLIKFDPISQVLHYKFSWEFEWIM